MFGETTATAIDHRPEQRKIYWVQWVNALTDSETGKFLIGAQIKRANLDGSGTTELLASHLSRSPVSFALDLWNNHFYWTEHVGGRIQRCPLTGCPVGAFGIGSSPELVLQTFEGQYSSATPKLGGLALDPANGRMYWAEDHTCAGWSGCKPPEGETALIYGGMVKSAKLDGTDVKELWRYSTTNSLQWASPLGVSIVIRTPRSTTTTTTAAPAEATTTVVVTANPNCKDIAGNSPSFGSLEQVAYSYSFTPGSYSSTPGSYSFGGGGQKSGDWADGWGYTCKEYEEQKWCTPSGDYGDGWGTGTFDEMANDGVTALQACCACGGGQV